MDPNYRLRIVHDSDHTHDSPRLWDNLGTMACWHPRYRLGDQQPTEDPNEWLESMPEDMVLLPLHLYDHSGVRMSTDGFSCPWDSGQVGGIYCTLEDARSGWSVPGLGWDDIVPTASDDDGKPMTLRQAVVRTLRAEVKTYDQYLSGDVHGFILERSTGRVDCECEDCDCDCPCECDCDCEHAGWEEVDSCYGFYGSDPEDNGIIEHMPDEARIDTDDIHEAFQNVEY